MVYKLRKTEAPYEIFEREIIQNISNPVALAIWVYILSKPNNWQLNKEQIKKHFNVGETRYLDAMRELRELGLYKVVRTKDSSSFTGAYYEFYSQPNTTNEQPPKSAVVENGTDIKETENISPKKNLREKALPLKKPKGFVYTSEFETVWSIYKQGDKWAGFRAYTSRIKEGYVQADIIKAIKAEKNKQFANRHFATTLNGDIDEVQTQQEEILWV